ncbi:hypothetical protein [Akkermansia sp.]|nr:hypothetical protein [Akkermansia sp.]
MKPLDCILLICLFGSFSVMLLLAYIAFAADAIILRKRNSHQDII